MIANPFGQLLGYARPNCSNGALQTVSALAVRTALFLSVLGTGSRFLKAVARSEACVQCFDSGTLFRRVSRADRRDRSHAEIGNLCANGLISTGISGILSPRLVEVEAPFGDRNNMVFCLVFVAGGVRWLCGSLARRIIRVVDGRLLCCRLSGYLRLRERSRGGGRFAGSCHSRSRVGRSGRCWICSARNRSLSPTGFRENRFRGG